MKVTNPIIPGFAPDPSICRVGGDYYLVVSSFEYFPAIPVFHSRDLVNWRQIGHVLDRPTQLVGWAPWDSSGMQAPTIRHIDGRFWVTCTTDRNFIVSADRPDGPWSDPVYIPQPGIDPSMFRDDDGAIYYTNSFRVAGPDGRLRVSIGQSRIELPTGRFIDPPREIWAGTGGQGPEAPHLYKINGVYYLMIAEGGTEYGHMETIARSKTPWGPWESCPRNPIMTNRSTDLPLQVCGHGDLVQAPDGSWWMVYLAVRPTGYHWVHVTGRETCLAPVVWDKDGWPVVGEAGRLPISFDAALPHPPHPWPAQPVRDDFDSPKLGHEWNHIRIPRAESYDLSHRPGVLTLWGSQTNIHNMFEPTWVGRRQRHQIFQATTCLEFAPGEKGRQDHEFAEAGLTVFMNYKHHYDLALVRRQQRTELVLRRRIGTLMAEESCLPVTSERVQLRVDADNQWYSFSASMDGKTWLAVGRGETRYLSTEVGGRFTGVMIGLYATGNGRKSNVPACFDWFDYLPGS